MEIKRKDVKDSVDTDGNIFVLHLNGNLFLPSPFLLLISAYYKKATEHFQLSSTMSVSVLSNHLTLVIIKIFRQAFFSPL